ncbi:hypothetical protein [Streptomyces sp. NPDC046862]|uniref:hypothetical protein n=1 Tax=Streptomyces sp. NPDC046862 TaxID=3154603 RepID=UPI0034513F59
MEQCVGMVEAGEAAHPTAAGLSKALETVAISGCSMRLTGFRRVGVGSCRGDRVGVVVVRV